MEKWRIRGVSDEGDELASDHLPKLEEKFNKVGLSLKKTDDSFKSTYEIMLDIAKVWDKLPDFSRAEILETVAGKFCPLA